MGVRVLDSCLVMVVTVDRMAVVDGARSVRWNQGHFAATCLSINQIAATGVVFVRWKYGDRRDWPFWKTGLDGACPWWRRREVIERGCSVQSFLDMRVHHRGSWWACEDPVRLKRFHTVRDFAVSDVTFALKAYQFTRLTTTAFQFSKEYEIIHESWLTSSLVFGNHFASRGYFSRHARLRKLIAG